ncbi:MAG: KamA family radical SAM protein [Desulfamplus sp.]|nr:KamA family radical SAM protein [Desulfamplus sp.]
MEIININSARWQTQLKNSIVTTSQLEQYLGNKLKGNINSTANLFNINIDAENSVLQSSLEKVTEKYPMRITPYYLSLIKNIGDPIWKQAVPDINELSNSSPEHFDLINSNDPLLKSFYPVNTYDPLNEDSQSPVPSIIHRYPDRVIFLVSNQCAMYCRYCMRKRKVGLDGCSKSKLSSGDHFESKLSLGDRDYSEPKSNGLSGIDQGIDEGVNYIRNNKMIRDVILSGGDPLLLSTEKLDRILFAIREIDHVETIRIHTRVLCTLPYRITENLASILEKYHPLYINTHFNHPDEITDDAASACLTLIRAGIPLGCQTVLLKGVNDNPEIMVKLMRKLIKIRVKPYYLHHPDLIAGTYHFRPSLETGINIMKAMRGNLTGIAIPHYMIDLPGGYGKVPLLPNYMKHIDGSRAVVENYQGKACQYWF